MPTWNGKSLPTGEEKRRSERINRRNGKKLKAGAVAAESECCLSGAQRRRLTVAKGSLISGGSQAAGYESHEVVTEEGEVPRAAILRPFELGIFLRIIA